MHYVTLYQYMRRMCLDDKYSKRLAGGKVYLIEDRLYVEFWNELVPVDKDNIDDIFSSAYRGGGNLHVYRIVNDRYRLLKVYSTYRGNMKFNMRRKELCIEKYGHDIIMLNLPTSSRVSLDGLFIQI